MSRSGSAASASTPVSSHDPTRPGPPLGLSLQGDIEYRPDRPLSYRARVRWTNPASRTRHSKSEAFAGRTQAEAWVEDMQRLARGGVDPYSATMTLAQYGDSIMPLAMRGLEPKCGGTQSGPSARRAARVDTGRARHVDDAPRPPRALGAGRSRFVVMVAAPTNPSGTGRPSSPSMAGIGLQIVILGGRQHAGDERWPRPDFSCGAMRCGARACPAGCGCCCAGRRCHRPRHLNSSRGRPRRRSPSRPRAR